MAGAIGGLGGRTNVNETSADVATDAAPPGADAADAPAAIVRSTSPSAGPRTDGTSSLLLVADLDAKLAASGEATASAPTRGPITLVEVKSTADAIPRTMTPKAQTSLDEILKLLDDRRVSHSDTRRCLNYLRNGQPHESNAERLTPGEFMAVIDGLRAAPWKDGKSMLDKLMDKGVQDAPDFIDAFLWNAANRIGKFDALMQTSGSSGSDSSMRFAGKDLLEYFGCKHHANYLGLGALGTIDLRGGFPTICL